jgi:hypothetical protein
MGRFRIKTRMMAILLLLSAIKIFLVAEVTSGFWTLVQPTSDVRNYQIDFSELTPFCSATSLANQCSLSVVDGEFRLGSFVSLGGGVRKDSLLGETFQALLTQNITNPNHVSLFFMDSIVKKIELSAPEAGYVDSVEERSNVIFLKTVEGNHAVLIKVDEYIGGLDRITYYWAYQSGGEKRLFKDALVELPPSLTIRLSVFSGRPDPEFTLTDPDAIARIVHEIYASVNFYLDSTVRSDDTMTCTDQLGYRSLRVTDMFIPHEPWGNYLYRLDICNSGIILTTDMMTSMMPPREFFHDPDSRLEKLIISICCSLNLQTTDDMGPVDFCAVVPDSLKSDVGIETSSGERHRVDSFNCIGNGKTLQVTMSEAGTLRADVFNLHGRYVNSIDNCRLEKGVNTIDVHHLFSHSGMYIIRLRSGKSVRAFSQMIQ